MFTRFFEDRALELAEAFGRMAPKPANSPGEAFDLSLEVFDRMLQSVNPRDLDYITGTRIVHVPHLDGPFGRAYYQLEEERAVPMKGSFKKLADYIPGAWNAVIIDVTGKQDDVLERLQKFAVNDVGLDLPCREKAYSIGIRYLNGVAHLLNGTQAPRDCNLAGEHTKPSVQRNLYAQTSDGKYQRRIRGLNF